MALAAFWQVAAFLPTVTASALLPLTPQSLSFADGMPKGKSLTPLVVRLRTAALRKPSKTNGGGALVAVDGAERMRLTQRRISRLVRAAQAAELPPAQASDLVDSIPTGWSARKRQVAVQLTHAFAAHGTVVRRGTFASLVSACRKAGELPEATELLACLHAVGLCTNPNVYSALMSDLCASGHPARALQLETSMREAGATPSNETLTVLLSSLGRARANDLATGLARRILSVGRNGTAYDLPLYNCLIQSLLRGGTDAEVREVVEQMMVAGLAPSVRTLNILLKGSVHAGGSLEGALEVSLAL